MNLSRLVRVSRTLLPLFLALGLSASVNAAPSIDLSGVTTVMVAFKNEMLVIGSILCVITLVFGIFSLTGGNLVRGITAISGSLLGAGIIGWASGWIGSLTNQSFG